MADYPLYMERAGITRKQAIDILNAEYHKFGKSTMTMICNPENYGVELTGEAERKLVENFGSHAGLSKRQRRKSNRKKGNKLTLRLDDSLYRQLKELYDRCAFASMQDMLEAAVIEFINRRAV